MQIDEADMNNIDFVLPWVDGSDTAWIELKKKYEASSVNMCCSDAEANTECRYRDYGLLKYWFRSVERFAPWVNRIFFVTCGQKPDWLDESNPRLRLVDHKDYIPSEYLPTFQSNTIELNLHRIADLSERFVLFNDDTFLLRPAEPEFFFKKGLPVIPCDLGVPYWLGYDQISRVVINNSAALKYSLDEDHLVWKNMWKYVDMRALGVRRAVKNFLSYAVNRTLISGSFGHLPQSHLKSTLETLWNKVPQIMDNTCRNKFRTDDVVNQWLACSWNMISGRFYPAHENRRGYFRKLYRHSFPEIYDVIKQRSFPMIGLGEGESSDIMEVCYHDISELFDKLLPERSSFEKKLSETGKQ